MKKHTFSIAAAILINCNLGVIASQNNIDGTFADATPPTTLSLEGPESSTISHAIQDPEFLLSDTTGAMWMRRSILGDGACGYRVLGLSDLLHDSARQRGNTLLLTAIQEDADVRMLLSHDVMGILNTSGREITNVAIRQDFIAAMADLLGAEQYQTLTATQQQVFTQRADVLQAYINIVLQSTSGWLQIDIKDGQGVGSLAALAKCLELNLRLFYQQQHGDDKGKIKATISYTCDEDRPVINILHVIREDVATVGWHFDLLIAIASEPSSTISIVHGVLAIHNLTPPQTYIDMFSGSKVLSPAQLQDSQRHLKLLTKRAIAQTDFALDAHMVHPLLLFYSGLMFAHDLAIADSHRGPGHSDDESRGQITIELDKWIQLGKDFFTMHRSLLTPETTSLYLAQQAIDRIRVRCQQALDGFLVMNVTDAQLTQWITEDKISLQYEDAALTKEQLLQKQKDFVLYNDPDSFVQITKIWMTLEAVITRFMKDVDPKYMELQFWLTHARKLKLVKLTKMTQEQRVMFLVKGITKFLYTYGCFKHMQKLTLRYDVGILLMAAMMGDTQVRDLIAHLGARIGYFETSSFFKKIQTRHLQDRHYSDEEIISAMHEFDSEVRVDAESAQNLEYHDLQDAMLYYNTHTIMRAKVQRLLPLLPTLFNTSYNIDSIPATIMTNLLQIGAKWLQLTSLSQRFVDVSSTSAPVTGMDLKIINLGLQKILQSKDKFLSGFTHHMGTLATLYDIHIPLTYKPQATGADISDLPTLLHLTKAKYMEWLDVSKKLTIAANTAFRHAASIEIDPQKMDLHLVARMQKIMHFLMIIQMSRDTQKYMGEAIAMLYAQPETILPLKHLEDAMQARITDGPKDAE